MLSSVIDSPDVILNILSFAIILSNLSANILTCSLAISVTQLNREVKLSSQIAQTTLDILADHNVVSSVSVGKCIVTRDLSTGSFILDASCRRVTAIVQLCIVHIASKVIVVCNSNHKVTSGFIISDTRGLISRDIFFDFKAILTGASGQFKIRNLNAQRCLISICLGIHIAIERSSLGLACFRLSVSTIRLTLVSLIGDTKGKIFFRCSALFYLIVLHNAQIYVIWSCGVFRCRRKRCGCDDGEHHGGSQNAREEFLQFHCYSSLVRNSSYSCAAAQTPQFTGRMPAASSGLRGITDCVAAVV